MQNDTKSSSQLWVEVWVRGKPDITRATVGKCLEKTRAFDPRGFYVHILLGVWFKCQKIWVFLPVSWGTHTQRFLLFVRDEQSCVVTERLHSRLSNSCIAQWHCIICPHYLCVCVVLTPATLAWKVPLVMRVFGWLAFTDLVFTDRKMAT